MAFKDIVVFVDSSRAGVVRLGLAAKLALRHAAHLISVYAVPENLDGYTGDAFVRGTKAIREVLDRRRRAEERAILRVGHQFSDMAARDDIRAEFRTVWHRQSDRNVIVNSLYADLVVVGQTQSTGLPEHWLPEHLLLANGVPLIMVPETLTSDIIGERVVLAWNASKEARRAADDAMPLLARAQSVSVIVVDAGKNPDRHGEEPGANIALHLARHGVRVEVERLASRGSSVAGSILAAADRLDADLIVMGANGHSRPRHLLFDSTTSAVRKDTRLPVPVLEAWRSVRTRAAELGRRLAVSARQSEACQLLMSIPGVGAVTATSFTTAIEDPANFKKSRSVGAWLGLTTRRYQSGEVDYDGHISRRGDPHLRGLLYEAATVIQTRAYAESTLRTWGLKLREKIGFKRAAVAVARKLAVIMHAMLKSGEVFDRSTSILA